MMHILSAIGMFGSAIVLAWSIILLIFTGESQGEIMLLIILGSLATLLGCMASLFCLEDE